MAPTASGLKPSFGGRTMAVSAEDNRRTSGGRHDAGGDGAQAGDNRTDGFGAVLGPDHQPGHEWQSGRGDARQDGRQRVGREDADAAAPEVEREAASRVGGDRASGEAREAGYGVRRVGDGEDGGLERNSPVA